MKRSTDQMLTTHVGSLPRRDELNSLMAKWLAGEAADAGEYRRAVRSAVDDAVASQAKVGLDVVNDGEQSMIGFVAYVNDRLAGCELVPPEPGRRTWGRVPQIWRCGTSCR